MAFPVLNAGKVFEIDKLEYEKLVRESEKLAVIKHIVESKDYVSGDDLKSILGIERKENEE